MSAELLRQAAIFREVSERVAVAERLLLAGAPTPWDVGQHCMAGAISEMFGDGRCAMCQRLGDPTWVGQAHINGQRMLAHEHRESVAFPGGIAAGVPGARWAVVTTVDEYGRMSDANRDLIIDAVNARRAQIDHARGVLQRHRTCGVDCLEMGSLAATWCPEETL